MLVKENLAGKRKSNFQSDSISNYLDFAEIMINNVFVTIHTSLVVIKYSFSSLFDGLYFRKKVKFAIYRISLILTTLTLHYTIGKRQTKGQHITRDVCITFCKPQNVSERHWFTRQTSKVLRIIKYVFLAKATSY